MTIFGLDIQTIYLAGLIISVVLTALYLLFGDLLDVVGDITPGSILNPVVVTSFIAIFTASGYIFEASTSLPSLTVIVISLLIALVIVSLIHFFILIPMSKAEQTMTFSINDLKGKSGKVISTIPKDGLGEILVSLNHSVNGYPARSQNNESINTNTEVHIIDVKDGVLIVEPQHVL